MKNPIFFISKHKNLSSTNSFGEYKEYILTGQLWVICNYIDDKIESINKEYNSPGQLWIINF
jgi:hypothetical protein